MFSGHFFRIQNLICAVYIRRIKQCIGIDLRLQVIDGPWRHGVGKQRGGIVGSKGRLDILVAVHKVQHKGLLIVGRTDAVQAGQCLHRTYAPQPLHHIHGTEFRLVESSLIFIGYQKHLVSIGIKLFCQPVLWEAVDRGFGVFRFVVR